MSRKQRARLAKESIIKQKKPTPYYAFMKAEIVVVKNNNSQLNYVEAFKIASVNWKHSKSNPFNNKY